MACRQLLEEPEWISYKVRPPFGSVFAESRATSPSLQARRYLAAAGKHGGPWQTQSSVFQAVAMRLSLEVWQRKLAVRPWAPLQVGCREALRRPWPGAAQQGAAASMVARWGAGRAGATVPEPCGPGRRLDGPAAHGRSILRTPDAWTRAFPS